MQNQIKVLKTLFSISNGKKINVIQFFIGRFLFNLTELLPPIATAGIISLIIKKDLSSIWFYVCLYLFFFIIHNFVIFWNQYNFNTISSYYQLSIQQRLFEHIINNNSIFNKISQGEIITTCNNDVKHVADLLANAAKVMANFVQIIIIFFIFSYYNIFVAIASLIVITLYVSLSNVNAQRFSKHFTNTRKSEDKIIDIFNQMLDNLKQVKSLQIMPSLNIKLNNIRKEWNTQYYYRYRELVNRYCKIPFITYVGKILLYVWLAYLVVDGKMTLDKLTLLVSYFEMMINKSEDMLSFSLDFNKFSTNIRRIKTILDYNATNNFINYGNLSNDDIEGVIQFDNVSYKVDGNLALDNISFVAKPKEITALVGKPGSGKSSVVNLLYRLYTANSGSILIDGENIQNYNQTVYTSNVSGVSQKNLIFKMSIKENLSLINPDFEEQIEACKKVGLHRIIKKLPKGYNTVLDQGNNVFSEGEKQKLAIARAILSKAEILLFDEITSNIDPYSITEIIKILKKLKRNHTIIIVTHRPEIMRIADQIIVLNQGRISHKGTNREVYKRSRLYRDLLAQTFVGPSEDDHFITEIQN